MGIVNSIQLSRRGVLVGIATVTALTSFDLKADEGGSSPVLSRAFTLDTPTKPAIEIKGAPRKLTVIPLAGGTVSGRLNGRVISGESWLETRDDENIEYLVRYLIQAENGDIIADQARGFIRMAEEGSELYTRTFHNFTAPEGQYAWLNRSSFVGAVLRIDGGRKIDVFEIT